MDIGKAFGFVFEDEKWITKVLIGGLLIWIPVVNFAVFGYMLTVAENVSRGVARPLPEWSNFGDLFMRGLNYFIITLVYQIPTLIVACIVGSIAAGFGASLESNPDSSAANGLLGVVACLYPLLIVMAIILAMASYPAIARYIQTGSLGEAFKFGDSFASLRNNLGTWVILILVAILASFVGQLGAIACGVGALFTLTYAQFVNGHALGQTMIKLGMGNTTIGEYSPPTTPLDPPPAYR